MGNRRSLLSLDNLVGAVACSLSFARTANETYLVADPSPVTLADVIVALRGGLGRPTRLFAVPPFILAAACKALGQAEAWDRLGGSLVVDPGKLMGAGWCPQTDTKAALVRFAKFARAT